MAVNALYVSGGFDFFLKQKRNYVARVLYEDLVKNPEVRR